MNLESARLNSNGLLPLKFGAECRVSPQPRLSVTIQRRKVGTEFPEAIEFSDAIEFSGTPRKI